MVAESKSVMQIVLLTIAIVFCLSGIATTVLSQEYPFDIEQYSFIKYEQNKLLHVDEAIGFDVFYNRWMNLILGADEQIEILHLGDSHIQADFFTERVRSRIQSFFPGNEGARGIVFPFNLAQTNNPGNYSITSKGAWDIVNGLKTKDSNTGIIPLKVLTYDSLFDLRIRQNDADLNTGFSETELWYYTSDSVYYQASENLKMSLKMGFGRLTLYHSHLNKDVKLRFEKSNATSSFELFGIWLKNSLPGITYHALGLNGAKAEDFVRCGNFSRFVSRIDPELIVISLGTNDIYSTHPNVDHFAAQYDLLIETIRVLFPTKAIVLTTPGDHLIRRYMQNRALPEACSAIHEIAEKYDCAVWDFYNIMGGNGSVDYWFMNGLSAKDRVHLSKNGYVLQGDLFFNALLRQFEKLMFDPLKE